VKRLVIVSLTAACIARAGMARAYESSVFIVDPGAPRPGDIVRVTVQIPPGSTAGSVTFRDFTAPGFVTGGLFNAYVGVDLDVAPGTYPVRFDFGADSTTREIEVHPREFGEERLTVDEKYTKLDDATEKRVAREDAELKKLWATTTPERLWAKAFVQPAAGPLGSPFGLRRFFNGEARSPHAGLDLKAPAGSPVVASNAGRVVLARDLFFTGNTIVIDHGLGLYTIYCHLSRIDAEEGKPVERSQPIVRFGAPVPATGPHLHWGTKLGGARVDPTSLPGMPR
jgi:murein DD-endopeptidase MepM/ murein hydrolase activator NlpD